MMRLMLLPIAASLLLGGVAIAVADCVDRRHQRSRAAWLRQRRRAHPYLSAPQKRAAGDALGSARDGGNGGGPNYQAEPSEQPLEGF